jgi:hypothetical protein
MKIVRVVLGSVLFLAVFAFVALNFFAAVQPRAVGF